METVTLGELKQAAGGQLLGEYKDPDTQITGAQSDSRKAGKGDVFFAFVGENMDGHRFVSAALGNGACGAVVSKTPEEFVPGKFYLKVPDTLKAAGDLARAYRRRFDIPVIGVTGSVGKTTMKDMIASVLSVRCRTLKTEGNFNNNIGLPRTILRLSRDTQIAVIEMGMNHMGEIDYLVHIAQPTAAVITNVGTAHIGNLGSRENIFKAKSEIFGGLAEGGLAVMNADDDFLPKLKKDREKQEKFQFCWVGESEDADFRAVDIRDTLEDCVKFRMITPKGDFDVTVPALGRHMIYPALTSAALGMHYGLSMDEIREGILAYRPTALRMETIHCGSITIYNDTYNANPQSMEAGLVTLSHTRAERRIAVLGDMLELGAMEEELHRQMGRKAAELQIDTLVTVGERAEYIADEAGKCGLLDVRSFRTAKEAEDTVKELVLPGSALYFKASHLMALEGLAAIAEAQARKKAGAQD